MVSLFLSLRVGLEVIQPEGWSICAQSLPFSPSSVPHMTWFSLLRLSTYHSTTREFLSDTFSIFLL